MAKEIEQSLKYDLPVRTRPFAIRPANAKKDQKHWVVHRPELNHWWKSGGREYQKSPVWNDGPSLTKPVGKPRAQDWCNLMNDAFEERSGLDGAE